MRLITKKLPLPLAELAPGSTAQSAAPATPEHNRASIERGEHSAILETFSHGLKTAFGFQPLTPSPESIAAFSLRIAIESWVDFSFEWRQGRGQASVD